MCLKASSLMSTSFRALPTPGIIEIRSFMLPIFLICWICSKKSSKPNWFWANFLDILRAASSSYCSCAFSTNDTMSPMPKIRSAIRAGWNTSSASIFSPTPTNLMGFSTTERIDKAAPPRVSPSNLVNTTPVKSNRSLNSLAVLTAS